jgi:hypothetical protein
MRSSTSRFAEAITRRALLGAAAAAWAAGPARAQTAQRFGRIVIDVSPLVAKGLGGYAEHIRRLLAAAFAKEFAGLVGGKGPTLVVQINSIQMSSYTGGGGGGPFRFDSGGAGSDYMDGTLITRSGNTVLSSVPMLAALTATSGGAWYLPDNEERRLRALCEFYASWSRRKLGL